MTRDSRASWTEARKWKLITGEDRDAAGRSGAEQRDLPPRRRKSGAGGAGLPGIGNETVHPGLWKGRWRNGDMIWWCSSVLDGLMDFELPRLVTFSRPYEEAGLRRALLHQRAMASNHGCSRQAAGPWC